MSGRENEGALFEKTELKNNIELAEKIKNKPLEFEEKIKNDLEINSSTPYAKDTNYFINLLLSLVCGIEKLDDRKKQLSFQTQRKLEQQRKLDSINSLNQTRREKWILNLNLILILTIASLLFIFFSI